MHTISKNYFNQYNNIITRKSFIAKMIAAKQNHSLNKTERERALTDGGGNQPKGDELTLLVKRREETPLSPSRLPSDSRADAHRVSTKVTYINFMRFCFLFECCLL